MMKPVLFLLLAIYLHQFWIEIISRNVPASNKD